MGNAFQIWGILIAGRDRAIHVADKPAWSRRSIAEKLS
jgi:hypothetical protein